MWLTYLAFTLILGSISLLLSGGKLRAQLGHRRVVYLIALVAIPALTLAIYAGLGSSKDLSILNRIDQLTDKQADGEEITPEDRGALIEAMRRRAEETQSAEYWYLVANQYLNEGQFQRAVESFAKASELSPDDVSIKAVQAEAMFLAAGNRLTQDVQNLITEVRVVDPNNVTINGLLGIAAFQVSQWQLAIGYWQRALEALPPMSPNAQTIRSSISRAQAMLGESDESPAGAVAAGDVKISVTVSLDPSVTADPSTTVFVFARASEGSAMPLAVKRMTVADLPAQISLTDADAMMDSAKLSRFPEVDLVARLSFSGSPTPSAGDYEASKERLRPDTNPELQLVIKDQLP
jgi:cytochrome c-type biogenesis protein CcmH